MSWLLCSYREVLESQVLTSFSRSWLSAFITLRGARLISSVSFVSLQHTSTPEDSPIAQTNTAWDPRGVGFSEPAISCFDTTEDGPYTFTAWLANETTLAGFQYPASGPSTKDIDTFFGNVQPWNSLMNTFTSACNKKNAEHLTQVGTVATVHDMVAIADAIIGPQAPINYYGYSWVCCMFSSGIRGCAFDAFV